ncbi:MAG: Rieske (2Fe-2S) protein [Alphaproteobacteria bacterium]|nr:Rieske (2Fe-2S) protein [Alphaproteobacteria bacterium]
MQKCGQLLGWKTERRALLGAGLGLAPVLAGVAHADSPSELPPQIGDQFVYLTGPKKGEVVKAADLPLGGPQVQAYPVDPKTKLVRDGSRLNLVVLIRLDPKTLDADTAKNAADGVVAYSDVCTHQGCAVNMWVKEIGALFCSCHGSIYDPKASATVLGGPAPRPLPPLGLKMEDGIPAVAKGFTERVGPEQV